MVFRLSVIPLEVFMGYHRYLMKTSGICVNFCKNGVQSCIPSPQRCVLVVDVWCCTTEKYSVRIALNLHVTSATPLLVWRNKYSLGLLTGVSLPAPEQREVEQGALHRIYAT